MESLAEDSGLEGCGGADVLGLVEEPASQGLHWGWNSLGWFLGCAIDDFMETKRLRLLRLGLYISALLTLVTLLPLILNLKETIKVILLIEISLLFLLLLFVQPLIFIKPSIPLHTLNRRLLDNPRSLDPLPPPSLQLTSHHFLRKIR